LADPDSDPTAADAAAPPADDGRVPSAAPATIKTPTVGHWRSRRSTRHSCRWRRWPRRRPRANTSWAARSPVRSAVLQARPAAPC